jgi:two-component system, NtrC family, response regulator AtoC
VSRLVVVLTVIKSAETRSLVRMVLEGAGHRMIESGGYEQARLLLTNGLDPDLLLVESIKAGSSEGEWTQLRQLLKSAPARSICLILGIGEQTLWKKASELEIQRFLTKPVTRGDLESVIDGLTHPIASDAGSLSPRTVGHEPSIPAYMSTVLQVEELGEDRYFLAASPGMLEIHRRAKLLANADVNVLILGESGTGKEVIAQLLHKHSRRSQYKFQKVNCAALPEDLLESELFGHRQGAFTGAIKNRPGKFEQAQHSTLLLDEIGEISSQMQAKFLQVLQDGQFTRLGADEPVKVDVRVIAATNIQMEKALQEKTFREDLYYRLSVFTLKVPPLRERREEIPYLIEETIRRSPAEMKNGSGCSFSSRLMDLALLYDWRGNVRELRNFVTRTIVMRDQEAAVRELETMIAATNESDHQDLSSSSPAHGSDMRSVVRAFTERTEVRMIQEALDASSWNRRHAAKSLNISYRGLLYKIQEHHLTPRRAAYSARRDVM